MSSDVAWSELPGILSRRGRHVLLRQADGRLGERYDSRKPADAFATPGLGGGWVPNRRRITTSGLRWALPQAGRRIGNPWGSAILGAQTRVNKPPLAIIGLRIAFKC